MLLSAALWARAAGFRRVSEQLCASWCLANALILVPTHVLGFAGALERGHLMIATATLCGGSIALWLLRERRSGRARFVVSREQLHALHATRFPVRGLVTKLALAGVLVVFAHACLGTWLLPSDAWDGIWYHDTIVGGTLQLGGYREIPLPDNLLQQANGFPRNAEMVGLWLVCWRDRSLIELPNTLAFLPWTASTYLLASRFSPRRAHALALACASCLLPGAILQLRSTYVDVYAASWCVIALAFGTRPGARPRHLLLAGLSLALFVGAKSTALLVAPGVLVWWGVAAWRTPRARTAVSIAALLTSVALSSVYVRNFVLFDNPVFPLAVSVPRLGIAWPGVATDVSANAPWLDTLAAFFLPAEPGRDFADIRRGGFGLAVAWLLVPLALTGVGLATRTMGAPARGRPAIVARARARHLWLLLTLVLPSVVLSPALWSARYHLAAVSVLVAAAAFALRAATMARLSVWLVGGMLVLQVAAMTRFSPPLGGASPRALLTAMGDRALDRATHPPAEWSIEPHVARARELELEAGVAVAFGPGVSFPSLLYNERFDNRLVYLPDDAPRTIALRLEDARARWIVAAPAEPLYAFASARPLEWELVGLISRGAPNYAFRRKPKPDR